MFYKYIFYKFLTAYLLKNLITKGKTYFSLTMFASDAITDSGVSQKQLHCEISAIFAVTYR